MNALKLLRIAGMSVLIGVLAGLSLGADYYRWTDDDGVVSFSQRPPPGGQAERISARHSRPISIVSDDDAGRAAQDDGEATDASDPAANEDQMLSVKTEGDPSVEQEAQLERLEAAERAREKEMAQIRETNCRNARDHLTQLLQTPRLHVTDEDGERQAISDAERQERIAEAERSVAEHCGSG